MQELATNSIKPKLIQKVNGHQSDSFPDMVAVEEPLEICISYHSELERVQKNISVTMRTPGNDLELAIGFLFTEGIFSSYENLKKTIPFLSDIATEPDNKIQIEFEDNFFPKLNQTERNFYTTSSCGVCGKSSLQSIKTTSSFLNLKREKLKISKDIFYQLQQKLRIVQTSFATTGGIHAAGLFNFEGELIALREDVGRHNALDKIIGHALINNLLPLHQYILLLSGRASFELIQKAAMAGIDIVAAIGAPSSLAVELAVELNITLIGFLKADSFNIYNLSDHLLIETSHENKD